jgi:hypothetical protein
VAEVLFALLHGHDVEPRHHHGDEREVLVRALLLAEVGDVPRQDEDPARALLRNLAYGFVRAESLELRVDVVVVRDVGLRERGA